MRVNPHFLGDGRDFSGLNLTPIFTLLTNYPAPKLDGILLLSPYYVPDTWLGRGTKRDEILTVT